MSLKDDKQQNIQMQLDFSSALTGEAREAGREGTEASGARNGTENPASTNRLMEEVCERENLKAALQRVKANKGSPGVDGTSGRAVVDSHTPTSGLALVDRAFELEREEWLKVIKDAGGDPLYRYLWPKLTKEIDPDAIVYLLDGRKDLAVIHRDIDDCLQDSISQYDGEGRLRLIYMFVNFYDIWSADREKRALLIQQVALRAAQWKFKYPVLERIGLRAFPTHICPYAAAWPELDGALDHLATDLRGYLGE